MKRLCLCLILWAAPLAAQEPVFSPAATERCLRAGGGTDCIGRSAEACMEDTFGGYSTVVMGGCYDRERQYWDDLLNLTYRRTALPAARAADAANGGFGPSQVDALREMQRAWIRFRDRTCDFERSLWGGGTGGGPAALACLVRMTAEQTFYLQDYSGAP